MHTLTLLLSFILCIIFFGLYVLLLAQKGRLKKRRNVKNGIEPVKRSVASEPVKVNQPEQQSISTELPEKIEFNTGLNIPLKEGKLDDRYQLATKLGAGAFAVVREIVDTRTQRHYAIKMINKHWLNKNELRSVINEVNIMAQLHHPHVIELMEVYDNPQQTLIVMELLTGGELFQRIVQHKRFSEQEASSIMKQLLSALEYIHSLGVVHMDVNPKNIIYVNETSTCIKLADFGLSNELVKIHSSFWNYIVGSPHYIAPEIVSGQSSSSVTAIDVWSAGIILYLLLSGSFPFKTDSQEAEELFLLISKAEYSFEGEVWETISQSAKDLVRKLLVLKPEQRLTAKDALEQTWFKENSEFIVNCTNIQN